MQRQGGRAPSLWATGLVPCRDTCSVQRHGRTVALPDGKESAPASLASRCDLCQISTRRKAGDIAMDGLRRSRLSLVCLSHSAAAAATPAHGDAPAEG